MRNIRDFFNCSNCKFGKSLFSEKDERKYCELNLTEIKIDGVCRYYMWDKRDFESRRLKIVDEVDY